MILRPTRDCKQEKTLRRYLLEFPSSQSQLRQPYSNQFFSHNFARAYKQNCATTNLRKACLEWSRNETLSKFDCQFSRVLVVDSQS